MYLTNVANFLLSGTQKSCLIGWCEDIFGIYWKLDANGPF